MKQYRAHIISILLLVLCSAAAANDNVTLEEMLQRGEKWLDKNIDPEIASQIKRIEPAAVRNFWRRLQAKFHGQYVIELAELKDEAALILMFLENIETAEPYAAWLGARLDYFDVIEEFKIHIPPPSSPQYRKGVLPPMNTQRKIWREEVESSPAPVGSRKYVPELKPIFVSAGVPAQLVWLAEVESSFNPSARSPVGAAGLFQFMPATARQYGLSLKPVDERLDPVKSARAAAKYLNYLHNRFQRWPLVLAAYNAGEGRVSRLLKKKDASSFAQIAADLPAETQLYVPKIEATVLKREGMDLRNL